MLDISISSALSRGRASVPGSGRGLGPFDLLALFAPDDDGVVYSALDATSAFAALDGSDSPGTADGPVGLLVDRRSLGSTRTSVADHLAANPQLSGPGEIAGRHAQANSDAERRALYDGHIDAALPGQRLIAHFEEPLAGCTVIRSSEFGVVVEEGRAVAGGDYTLPSTRWRQFAIIDRALTDAELAKVANA